MRSSTVRNLTIGFIAYFVARLANPDASSWRTLAITLVFIIVMAINEVWSHLSGN